MIGVADEGHRFDDAHPAIMRAQRNHPDVRIGASGTLYHELLPTILAQRISSREAMAQWRRLCLQLGEPAPGPMTGLRLPPHPDRLAAMPSWWFHPHGVERGRADTLRTVAKHAAHLWEWGRLPAGECAQKLVLLPGVGEWTIGMVLASAFGEPDAIAVATALAAPLVEVGGYVLPGLVGAAAALAAGLLALTLPEESREPSERTTSRDALAEWWTTLRDGLADVSRTALLRRAVLVTALLTGLMAFDEYLPLLAADRGASPATTALALVGVGVAETLCVALAGRVARARGPVLGVLLALAAVTVGAGALLPLGPGFAAIALGWGVLQMLLVVVETRVQDEVTGDARATVTSVAGLGSEGVALGVLAVVGTGSVWVGLPVLVAALAAPMLGVAVLLARS